MRKILLVDDDPLVLKMYQDGLSQLGAQVTTAGDGLAAIRALRNGKPDAMVLDLMMPRLTGVDVLKFVRSEPTMQSLPVVVLSNSYMNAVAAEAAGIGVQKALLKVRCSPSVLIETINDVVAGKSHQGTRRSCSPCQTKGRQARKPPGLPDEPSTQPQCLPPARLKRKSPSFMLKPAAISFRMRARPAPPCAPFAGRWSAPPIQRSARSVCGHSIARCILSPPQPAWPNATAWRRWRVPSRRCCSSSVTGRSPPARPSCARSRTRLIFWPCCLIALERWTSRPRSWPRHWWWMTTR